MESRHINSLGEKNILKLLQKRIYFLNANPDNTEVTTLYCPTNAHKL